MPSLTATNTISRNRVQENKVRLVEKDEIKVQSLQPISTLHNDENKDTIGDVSKRLSWRNRDERRWKEGKRKEYGSNENKSISIRDLQLQNPHLDSDLRLLLIPSQRARSLSLGLPLLFLPLLLFRLLNLLGDWLLPSREALMTLLLPARPSSICSSRCHSLSLLSLSFCNRLSSFSARARSQFSQMLLS